LALCVSAESGKKSKCNEKKKEEEERKERE
jgi:hypothetical protein